MSFYEKPKLSYAVRIFFDKYGRHYILVYVFFRAVVIIQYTFLWVEFKVKIYSIYLKNKLVVGKKTQVKKETSKTSGNNVIFKIYFCRHVQIGMNIFTENTKGNQTGILWSFWSRLVRACVRF